MGAIFMGGTPIKQGDKFGRLTAREMTHKFSKSGRKRAHWICDCECGGGAIVDSGNLRNGNTRWCSRCSANHKSFHKTTHGHTRKRSPTKSYRTWDGMKKRIFDPKDKRYDDYGGRGLDMDPRWRDSFEAFLEDMGEPPSKAHQIDRVDNDRGYWPDNCRWASRHEQGCNKRNNVLIEWCGETKALAEWCRYTGVSYNTAKRRLYSGQTDPAVIFSPQLLKRGPKPGINT